MKINEYITKSYNKIKGCTHKDTYISAANYFRQPLLVPNNAKALHFYQIVHYTNFLSFPLIDNNQNIRNKRQFWKNQWGVLTKLRIYQVLVILFIIKFEKHFLNSNTDTQS